MKKLILSMIIFMLMIPAAALCDRVKGHWRDTDGDGIKETWVRPHYRTNPNDRKSDNYSYPGNYNPNTGKYTPDKKKPVFPLDLTPKKTKKKYY